MKIEKHAIKSREQWLALRMQDLTASDIGAYLGMTPWKSPAELIAEKRGLIPQQENESRVMRRGRRDEYAILRIIADEERPQWKVNENKVYVRAPEFRLGCTPDAIAIDDQVPGIGVIQCKSVASEVWRTRWLTDPDDYNSPVNIPLPYHLQTLTERMLSGATWAVLAVWVRSAYTEDLKLLPVPADPTAEENLRNLALQFWEEVESGNTPRFDHKRDEKVIELFYPKETELDPPRDLSLDNEAIAMMREFCDVRTELNKLKDRKSELSAGLKAKLGTYAKATGGDYSMSWKTQSREEHLVDRWEGRVLRVNAPRKKKPSEEETEATEAKSHDNDE